MSDERTGHSDEERFAEIVARLRAEEQWPEPDDSASSETSEDGEDQQASHHQPWPTWPKQQSHPEQPRPADDPEPVEGADSAVPQQDPLANLPVQWRAPTSDTESLLDANDEYEPPPPAPLPAGDLSFWGALAGLVAGPLWLLYLVFFDRYARTIWWVLACLLFVAGFALLVLRQPRSRDDDWDDEVDGAEL